MEQGKAKQGKYKTTNWTSYNAALKTWAEDNDRQTWIGYNKLRGQYMSALEHAVPEQFFHDPAQCNSYGTTTPVAGLPDCPRGISAMSALGIAAAQGQKIYTITQKVYASHPNIVNTALGVHTPNTRSRVQQALDAGHEVTIHERPITESGWKGAGYTLIDPTTGAGAYIIEGGANGGWALIAVGILAWIAAGVALPGLIAGGAFIGAMGSIAFFLGLMMVALSPESASNGFVSFVLGMVLSVIGVTQKTLIGQGVVAIFAMILGLYGL
jgi:hypothetical protein